MTDDYQCATWTPLPADLRMTITVIRRADGAVVAVHPAVAMDECGEVAWRLRELFGPDAYRVTGAPVRTGRGEVDDAG